MANIVFNGFSKDEIVALYKFICQYNANIKDKNLSKITGLYPRASTWDSIICPNVIKYYASEKDVINSIASSNDKKFHFPNIKGSILKSFLYYTLEAIYIGDFKKKGNKIIISCDSKECHAFGELNAEDFFSFINLFIKK